MTWSLLRAACILARPSVNVWKPSGCPEPCRETDDVNSMHVDAQTQFRTCHPQRCRKSDVRSSGKALQRTRFLLEGGLVRCGHEAHKAKLGQRRNYICNQPLDQALLRFIDSSANFHKLVTRRCPTTYVAFRANHGTYVLVHSGDLHVTQNLDHACYSVNCAECRRDGRHERPERGCGDREVVGMGTLRRLQTSWKREVPWNNRIA